MFWLQKMEQIVPISNLIVGISLFQKVFKLDKVEILQRSSFIYQIQEWFHEFATYNC